MIEIPIEAKELEILTIKRDSMWDKLPQAISICKQFIRDHKLIVYGGLAIDYALRLKGSRLYPDDMPENDLDFFSPENVIHAYKLADLYYDAGLLSARAINAEHMATMRVDIGENHFLADLTYKPAEAFSRIPHLEYDGVRFVDPLYQRIDIHASFAYPYEGVPREVIFARWAKDLKRFNMLDAAYPVPVIAAPDAASFARVFIDNSVRKYLLTGQLAYNIIAKYYTEHGGSSAHLLCPFEITQVDGNIAFMGSRDCCEIMHFGSLRYLPDPQNIRWWNSYAGIIPRHADCTIRNQAIPQHLTIYDAKNRLIACNSVNVDGVIYRVANIHACMNYFLSRHFTIKDPADAAISLAYYVSLLTMAKSPIATRGGADNPLFMSTKCYGSTNINLAQQVTLNRMENKLRGVPLLVTPKNYNVGRSRECDRKPPEFDVSEVRLFCEFGQEEPDGANFGISFEIAMSIQSTADSESA